MNYVDDDLILIFVKICIIHVAHFALSLAMNDDEVEINKVCFDTHEDDIRYVCPIKQNTNQTQFLNCRL